MEIKINVVKDNFKPIKVVLEFNSLIEFQEFSIRMDLTRSELKDVRPGACNVTPSELSVIKNIGTLRRLLDEKMGIEENAVCLEAEDYYDGPRTISESYEEILDFYEKESNL